MDRSEGQEACLNPSVSSITVPITAFTLSLPPFFLPFSIHLQPFFILLSLLSNFKSVFCLEHLPLTYPFLTLLSHFFVSLFRAIFVLSPTISHIYLYCSSPSPFACLLSPKGLRLTAVDYHTSKELPYLRPFGPISFWIEHQSIYSCPHGQNLQLRTGICICMNKCNLCLWVCSIYKYVLLILLVSNWLIIQYVLPMIARCCGCTL